MNKLSVSILLALVAATALIIPIACTDSGDGDGGTTTPPTTAPAGKNGGGGGGGEPSGTDGNGDGGNGEHAAAKLEIPSYWFDADYDWAGQRYDEVELFQYLVQHNEPANLDEGKRYVVFYSRSCEHCEAMFKEDLVPNMTLAAQVTAVEIPAGKKSMRGADAWAMPENGCELLELPLGCNWVITPPLAVRLEDGVITCAGEKNWRECMELE